MRTDSPLLFTRTDTPPGDGACIAMSEILASSGLATSFVPMSAQEGAEHALQHYALSGVLTRFATEKDDTFHIQPAQGAAFILKIANPDEPEDEIALQVALLKHLSNVAPTIPAPRILPDRHGQDVPEIADRAGQKRRMRLMSYLPGTVLDTTRTQAHEREKIGEALARLRLATATFSHPCAGRKLAWDVQHLQGLRLLLPFVQDAAKRERLQTALERHAALAPQVSALRKQVLHNDFSQSNIVVDHKQPQFVTGIIDFGDTVHTAIAIDVATALLNQLPRDATSSSTDDLFAQGRDLLRGYLRVADLQPNERALIPHLVMARVVARALLTHWRASFMPHNAPYILRNTEPGWGQLEWLLARQPDALSDLLMDV